MPGSFKGWSMARTEDRSAGTHLALYCDQRIYYGGRDHQLGWQRAAARTIAADIATTALAPLPGRPCWRPFLIAAWALPGALSTYLAKSDIILSAVLF